MADPYQGYPFEQDPDSLAQDAFAFLQSRIPGWVPRDSALDSRLIAAVARATAELMVVAADVPDAAYDAVGERLFRVPRAQALAATVQSTWTAVDANGPYVVEAGMTVRLRPVTGGEGVFFEVQDDVTIPNGATATADGEVTLVAQDAGVVGNDVGGVGADVEVLDTRSWLVGAVATGTAEGGADAEDASAYRAKLTRRLSLFTERCIQPPDFRDFARDFAYVHSVQVVDLFDPGPGPPYTAYVSGDAAAGNVTVVARGFDGRPLSSPQRTELAAAYEASVMPGMAVHVVDPGYQGLVVEFVAQVFPGQDPDVVVPQAEAAVQTALHPAVWATPPGADPSTIDWLPISAVEAYELSEVINRVPGIWRVQSLKLAPSGSATVEGANVPLGGGWPFGYMTLPDPDDTTVTGTAA